MSDKVSKLQKWARYDGSDRIVTSEEYIEEKGEGKALKVLHSQFGRLDKTLSGFVPGELVVIGGPTGQGKTTLCLSLTEDFSGEKAKSVWFSYEMQPERMIKRLGPDFPIFTLPLELEDSGLEWIEKRIMEAIAKHSIWAVFIDHLHYLIKMKDLARAKSTSVLLGSILRELKKIALKTDTVIFLVSHVRKFEGNEPSISDLRDCLSGDQLVMTHTGPRPIKNVGTDDKTFSYRSIRELQPDVITHQWEAGEKEICELTTKTGRKIKCSAGQRFYALTNKGGKFGPNQGRGIQGWTRAINLEVGQKIAVVKEYPPIEGNGDLTVAQATLWGWLIGDGHVTENGYSEITVGPSEDIATLIELGSAWGLSPSVTPYEDRNAFRVYLTGGDSWANKLARFLRRGEYTWSGCDKRVPDLIFGAGNNIIAGFLKGLFHADGSVNKMGIDKNSRVVTLHTISEKLARGVQHLLLRFGIISYLREQDYSNELGRHRSGWFLFMVPR